MPLMLFMEKGIAATSMDDIAKAAGYSKATLYVYFENKIRRYLPGSGTESRGIPFLFQNGAG